MGGHSVMTDNSVSILQSILNLVLLEIKYRNILVYFATRKIRVQSRPNNIIDVSNTKLGHYLVKHISSSAIFRRFFMIILLVIDRINIQELKQQL
jgi:hypothetical protein